jgi:hypothetical protein
MKIESHLIALYTNVILVELTWTESQQMGIGQAYVLMQK